MIFSLLNVRKKTAAVIAGIVIAATCLWGLAMWQDISIGELMDMLMAVLLMLLVIVLSALLLTVAIKLLARGVHRLLGEDSDDSPPEN